MQRRLTAILAADVVGYSGAMEADEAGTLDRLKRNRTEVFDPSVARHGGRIVKLMGDGALVEFGSVVAAVDCALAIQRGSAADARESGRETPLRYRIGINLGDVIVEGDDLYGEGVNVAARLQALAPEGGIAISAIVRDQVAGKVSGTFDDMGEHVVKNLQRPVHVFVLQPTGERSGEAAAPAAADRRTSICVLPFVNMSGDPEQEYFSDGITEDIITDLSKVSALWVAARNTAFTLKGKAVDVPQVARRLKVGYVLEGSVRKSGGRVRITAQLIDGASGGHVWAERFDRTLDDIFAVQDEISQSIVDALKLKLLPEEKKAIEQRGTTSAAAYKLYLMARQLWLGINQGDARRSEAIVRICRRATEIDPGYARAWALLSWAEGNLRFFHGRENDGGMAAADRAVALDRNLAEARAARAQALFRADRKDEALDEIATGLALDPECYEVNAAAGRGFLWLRRFADAITAYEKAAARIDDDFMSAGMLMSCYTAIGDKVAARDAARRTLERAERVVAVEPVNGSAMSFIVTALATLGEAERCRDWTERALLLDPDNVNMRYNFACMYVTELHDHETALDLLEPIFAATTAEPLGWAKVDADLDAVRDHPRYLAMVAAAEARLAGGA